VSTLNIKDPETHRLATALAKRTGQSLTAAVKQAIQERLARERARAQRHGQRDAARWMAMAHTIAAAPERDPRSADAIIGYNEFGLPT
jgi:antitoxin VapB